MKEYKISQVRRLDEWESQYGAMVTFAIAIEGYSLPVKLNQKTTTPEPQVGDTLTGEIQDATDGKGQGYKKFKKINPQYQNQPQQQQSQAAPQMEYIVMMLEELTGRREVGELGKPQPPVEEDPFAGLDI